MIILDSDILITLMDKNSPLGDEILLFLKKYKEQKVTTSLNLEEILYGIYKKRSKNTKMAENTLLNMTIIPFSKEDAIIASKIEVEMEKKGSKRPRGDILIASIAIRTNAKLLTLNKKHFIDIPGLEILNFTPK